MEKFLLRGIGMEDRFLLREVALLRENIGMEETFFVERGGAVERAFGSSGHLG